MKNFDNKYTLLIPTFNRSADLTRLLKFLSNQKANFPIIILDSSSEDIKEKNRAEINQSSLQLNIQIENFSTDITPWEKFWQGSQLVKTEYTSLCADDDLILIPSLTPLLSFLEKNPDYGVAHGWYFNFYLNGAMGLTGIVYQGKSIDEDEPLQRLHHLFSNYEALSYGVHRTEIMQNALLRMRHLQSMLGRELLGGGIAALSGKVARLPILYAGRSLGPSASYVNWHPIEFLLSSPQSLFDEYKRYRDLLLESYKETVTADTIKQVDLAHLRYLSEYLKPAVVDYLINQLYQNTPREEIVSGLWPILSQQSDILTNLQKHTWFRRLKKAFPKLRRNHFRRMFYKSSMQTIPAVTNNGVERRYEIYNEFIVGTSTIAHKKFLAELMDLLNLYE